MWLLIVFLSVVVRGGWAETTKSRSVKYRGCQSVAANNYHCVNWKKALAKLGASQNEISSLDENYGVGDHSFCRNPRGEMPMPWCYALVGSSYTKVRCGLKEADLDLTDPARDTKCLESEGSRERSGRKLPQSYTGKLGEPKMINCAKDCTKLTVWGENRPPSGTLYGNGSIHFEALTKEDEGEWECSCGAMQYRIDITVTLPPVVSAYWVPAGYELLVSCAECSRIPNWDTRPPSGELRNNGSIFIPATKRKDEGRYDCTCGDETHRVRINVCEWMELSKTCRFSACGEESYSECEKGERKEDHFTGQQEAIVAPDGGESADCQDGNCGYCTRNTLQCGIFGLCTVAVAAVIIGLYVNLHLRAKRAGRNTATVKSGSSPGTFRPKEEALYEVAAAISPAVELHNAGTDKRSTVTTVVENLHTIAGTEKRSNTGVSSSTGRGGLTAELRAALMIRSKHMGSKEIIVSGSSGSYEETDDDGTPCSSPRCAAEARSDDGMSRFGQSSCQRSTDFSGIDAYFKSPSQWSVFETVDF